MTLAGFKVIAEPDSGQGDKADVRLLQIIELSFGSALGMQLYLSISKEIK